MCNAVVLGAVRWRSPGVVTVNTPAPASCMESLSPGRLTRAVVKCLDSFQSLQAIPDENKFYLALGLLEMRPKKSCLPYHPHPLRP
jgi:hypothetical protein